MSWTNKTYQLVTNWYTTWLLVTWFYNTSKRNSQIQYSWVMIVTGIETKRMKENKSQINLIIAFGWNWLFDKSMSMKISTELQELHSSKHFSNRSRLTHLKRLDFMKKWIFTIDIVILPREHHSSWKYITLSYNHTHWVIPVQ